MQNHTQLRLLVLFWLIFLVFIGYISVGINQKRIHRHFQAKKELVNAFQLTDYCFTTESRHTRHFTMPEWIAPFQDLPAYHEHFPSSSFFPIHKQKKK